MSNKNFVQQLLQNVVVNPANVHKIRGGVDHLDSTLARLTRRVGSLLLRRNNVSSDDF